MEKELEIFGHLAYSFGPKIGGTPIETSSEVFSIKHADDLFNILSQDSGKLVYSNFRLLDPTKKNLIKKYEIGNKQSVQKPPARRITPTQPKGRKL
ncbi:hypothetical protein ACQKLP_11025 [Chitinophaga sp. NPDC101104]|uniref:hypothetical protein n=1 Tax=Chitinophaga sp. NPDC101104 TaxID=3390561 RepID=UPI003D00C0F9